MSEGVASTAHVLEIVLRDVRPPVRRRVRVPSAITLGGLHEVLQTAMGWFNCHLHQFRIGDLVYGVSDDDDPMGEFIDEGTVTLADLTATGMSFLYEYDLGDGWEHDVIVEAVVAAAGDPRCVCLEATGACPPEDCGGPWAYRELLATLADPTAEDHAEMKAWVGQTFDATSIDLDAINAELAMLPG